ncbi:ComGF family competence protein [Salirhabdus salicampi]|uniref:ComGF family competence protein n=1 Tax=Salirhabdus salicampi TaxID=476102 RepID=UPI0020C49999|nr:ComGF family competence protein [Salirhabdus salicampi]MCP8616850.1 ComGF family competence protein [Salirhabdus salicampi]
MARHDNGYTFISILCSLGSFIVIIPFFFPLIKAIVAATSLHDFEMLSVEQFYHFFQEELYVSEEHQLRGEHTIDLYQQGKTITIDLYQDMIRRRVNDTGHEIMLFHVDSFSLIKENESTLIFHIKTKRGNKYEKRLSVP